MHHDLIVIGTGSGNMVVDHSFADVNVAFVEERRAGGTCLNYGCVPSKMLAYGWAMQDDSGFCKVLVDAGSGLILGAHLMGPQAASMIQIFVVATEFDITATDLAMRPYWIHPALTEVVENALLDVKAAA